MSRPTSAPAATRVDKPQSSTPAKGESVPIGTIWLSGIVRTTTGYAVAQLELPAEDWKKLVGEKVIGTSQTFPEHVARAHKQLVMSLAQRTQFQRSRFKP